MGIEKRQNADGTVDYIDDLTSVVVFKMNPHGDNFSDAVNKVTDYDDFLGKAIDGRWGVQKGSDGATVNFAFNAQTSGAVRATTGAGAGASMAVNGVQLDRALNWKATNGGLIFEAKVRVSAITTIAFFVGLTNQVASLQIPVNSSGSANGLTYNAADCVGFLFDTSMTTANYWLTGQANSVPGTAVNIGSAPVAATYDLLRIEIDVAGNAKFFKNGVVVGSVALAVTPTTALTPCITCFTRAAGSATVDVDSYFAQQTR